jgi:hypothetical protein
MTGIAKLRLFVPIIVLSLLGAVVARADPPSQVGRLSFISGSVSLNPGSVDEWAPATLNYPLTAGDRLWTDSGARAEVQVVAAAIRLNSNTDFSFLNLDDQTVQVSLPEGSLNVTFLSADGQTVFEIDTPNATVSLPVAGRYRIDVQPNGDTDVTVRSGRAELTAGEDAYDVLVGQSSHVSGLDSISSYVTAAERPDDWDAWNEGRDSREERAASHADFSRTMIGAEDLDENGTWVNEAGDGPSWVPSHVPAGWAPYRFGHWSWVAPWGWTWIDDTSWGFAPFHYGRWGYRNARWEWSPGAVQARPVYAPALVVFIGGSGWTPAAGAGIGWFPLGPRELYIPPYTVSPAYVQRINIAQVTNINVQVIERFNPDRAIYANRSAPHGVTVVPRDVFIQSRPAGGAMLSISQAEITRAPLMGMTARIAPQRASIIAQGRVARAAVPQPPADMTARRVHSRVAPAPARVPFAQQQKALAANPGRPIDASALSALQRSQKAAPPAVIVVNPATLTRLKNPPVLKSAPRKVAPVKAPASQKVVTPAPRAQQPVAAKPAQEVQHKPPLKLLPEDQ